MTEAFKKKEEEKAPAPPAVQKKPFAPVEQVQKKGPLFGAPAGAEKKQEAAPAPMAGQRIIGGSELMREARSLEERARTDYERAVKLEKASLLKARERKKKRKAQSSHSASQNGAPFHKKWKEGGGEEKEQDLKDKEEPPEK